MTTTDFGSSEMGSYPPPPSTAATRLLRRSRNDRVGAGVAGGLGRYFDVDPVLFRVLFATSAFFGGAGIFAYLLSWAAIPEEGTEQAAVDGWIAALRRRRIPFWIIALVGGALLWLIAFSWWAPGPFVPVLAVVVLLVVALTRSGRRAAAASARADAATATSAAATGPQKVDLHKGSSTASGAAPLHPTAAAARGWLNESLAAGRARRRRAAPVRLATLGALVVAMTVLGIIDANRGIVIPAYLWTALGIILVGLFVGAVLRRTPWSVAGLLIPVVAGLIGFGATRSSLRDGIGQTEWRPTTAPAADYRLAIGQGVLDLRKLSVQRQARNVSVTMAAGQVRILAPKTLNLTVDAHVHFGNLTVDGQDYNGGSGAHNGGMNYNRTVDPPAGATGAPITVTVHVADGNIDVQRS